MTEKKFRITGYRMTPWQEEATCEIEADTAEAALSLFHAGDYEANLYWDINLQSNGKIGDPITDPEFIVEEIDTPGAEPSAD